MRLPTGETTPEVGSPRLESVPAAPSARARFWRWAAVVGIGLAIAAVPRPEGIAADSWNLLAIFVATVAGLTLQPLPGGAMVLLGVGASVLLGVQPIATALSGYGDPIVWLVLAAFFMSRGMIKTGLGRRIAFSFIRVIGRHSLGLGYALVLTDALLGMVIPSTGARAGGILLPVSKSLAEAYESRPGVTAERLGAFLMPLLYQCDVIVCAMFLTGQASNVLIAKFAGEVTGIQLTYS